MLLLGLVKEVEAEGPQGVQLGLREKWGSEVGSSDTKDSKYFYSLHIVSVTALSN